MTFFRPWVDDDPPDKRHQFAALYFSSIFWGTIILFAVVIVPATVLTAPNPPIILATPPPASCVFEPTGIILPMTVVQHGWSISMGENGTEIISSDPSINSTTGEVKSYTFSGSGWTQSSNTVDGGMPSMAFGAYIELTPDGLHFCASFRFEPEHRIFQRSSIGAPWVQKGSSISSGESSGSRCSLSDDGNRVAIAMPNEGFPAPLQTGKVRVYDFVVSAWVQVGFDVENAVGGSRFGDRGLDLTGDGSRLFVSSREAGAHMRTYEFILGSWVLVGVPFGNYVSAGAPDIHHDIMSKEGNYVGEYAGNNISMYRWDGANWQADGTCVGTYNFQFENRLALIEIPTPRIMVGTTDASAAGNGVSFCMRTAPTTWTLIRTIGPFSANRTGYDVTQARQSGYNCAISDIQTGIVTSYSCCWNENPP